jgi:hypothetical protein
VKGAAHATIAPLSARQVRAEMTAVGTQHLGATVNIPDNNHATVEEVEALDLPRPNRLRERNRKPGLREKLVLSLGGRRCRAECISGSTVMLASRVHPDLLHIVVLRYADSALTSTFIYVFRIN